MATIERLLHQPVVLNEYLPRDTLENTLMRTAVDRRRRLLIGYRCMERCHDAPDLTRTLGSHGHLCCLRGAVLFICRQTGGVVTRSVGYWSLRDLQLVRDDRLCTIIQAAVDALIRHAKECTRCHHKLIRMCACGRTVSPLD